MAALHAKHQRQQRLDTLDIQYPLWLFDIDDPRWPRRLDSLLPDSYPAKLTGWIASTSEYEMLLDRPQDLSQAQEKGKKVHSAAYHAALAHKALQQLRYDDRYSLSPLQAVVQQGKDHVNVRLDSWTFEQNEPGWVDPAKVQRIERIWDEVPLWNSKIGLERLADFDAIEEYYGVAILLADDGALVAATGMPKTDAGEAIRKAEFERLDNSGGVVQGIVCPSRWRGPGDHGLKLNQGPSSALNRRLIAGTALQDAGWEAVEEYAKWQRRSPLLKCRRLAACSE
jgi:hypothetical protein